MNNPQKSLVRLAAVKFAAGDYQSALELYESAAALLGEENFRANIYICSKKLISKNGNRVQTKKTDNGTNQKLIELSNSVSWQSFVATPKETIYAQGIVKVSHGGEKSSIALIRFLDQKGNQIDTKKILLPRSDVFGKNFVYLKDSAEKPNELFRVKVPEGAVKVEVGFRLFTDDKKTSVVISNFEIFKIAEKEINFNKFGEIIKSPNEFKVALIADEFTYNSFKDEFDAIPIEPETWRDSFIKNKPDIFFCESAWSGPDSVRRPWKGKVYASKNFSWENRKELLEIIAFCRKEGIPSIFWNKEDPSHYADRINDFVKTATEFDYVFTSAEECIDRYKKDYGLKNVYALPFATNPRLFNPIVETRRSNKLVFAGSWYATHPDRCAAMESILDQMIAQGIEIEIYDRYYGSNDPNRSWPERFKIFLKPNVPHEKMAEVYKSSYFGLNFNTVTDSATMFARRVFELISCNTLVVSNYSAGVEIMFGQLVVFADKEPGRLKNLKKNEIDQLREKALNLVLKEHTYKRRWEQILDHVGIKYHKRTESVTVIYPVQTRKDAENGIAWFNKNSIALTEARLLLVVDDSVDDIDIAPFYQDFNKLGVTVTSVSHAKKYSLEEKYQPVETEYFLLANTNEDLPRDFISRAIPHIQYMKKYLIAQAKSDDQKYSISKFNRTGFFVGHKDCAVDLLKSALQSHKIYYI